MRWRNGMVVLVCGSLALGACGGDDDDADASSGDAPSGADGADGAGGADGGGSTSAPADSGDTGSSTELPDDACAVLPADQVNQLVPGAKVDGPFNQSAGGVAFANCGWDGDSTTLTLTYNAPLPEAMMNAELENVVKDAGGELTTIAGDKAGVFSHGPGDLNIGVVHGDAYMTLEFLDIGGADIGSRRDALVTLADAAASAL